MLHHPISARLNFAAFRRVLTASLTPALSAALLLAPPAEAQILDSQELSLQAVKAVASAAAAEARANNWNVVIAIVDAGGHLLYLERMDGVQTGSVQVATDKAKSAAAFRRPTLAFHEGVASGNLILLGLSGAVPVEGGVPLMSPEGHLLGAIGVSGVTAQQDGIIAGAGSRVLER